MLSGLTAHTCARPATISRRTLSSHLRPCELRSGLRWGLFCSHTLVAQGLPAAQASRPPGEACGTLGRGPCSRPFPVCVRLFCYVKITLSRNVFFKKRIWHKKTCMKQAKGKKDMQADYGRRNMAAFTEELPHEFEALLRLSPGTIFGMTPGTL